MSQAGLIDIESANPQIPTSFETNDGTAIPLLNVLEILGVTVGPSSKPVETTGSGNTVNINVQLASEQASPNVLNAGLASFDSAAFDVSPSGFVQLNGGGIAVTSFNIQSNTAPGTDPVVPTSAGVVTVNGAVVGNHSVVLETRSRAANAYNLEIQYAAANAATDGTKSGVAHFNSTQFSVDANGFVQLSGGGLAIDSFQPDSGTNPVVPDGNGLVVMAGSGSTTTVGSLNTLTFQLTGLTNHAVLVGAGTATITKIAATANTGAVLQNNSGADPSYSTATYPSTTTVSQLLYSSSNNVVAGLATVNRSSLSTSSTGVPTWLALTNGQIVIGSTAGAPAAASISAGTGISVTPGSNSITIANTGAITDLHTARFIVSAGGSADGANYTTIALALAAATSGSTIFIQPGTYTENLTLKAGVNLVAFSGDEDTPNVTIVGKATFTAAGSVTISNIRLQTTSDFVLAVTGSAASIVNLESCYLNCTNNTGISFTSSSGSSQINLYYCITDLTTTGIALFVSTAAGSILFEECDIRNSGNSLTASTNSVAGVTLRFCICLIVFSCSGTGSFVVHHCGFGSSNTIVFTLAGTASSSFEYSFINSGSAAAISVGTGTTASVNYCRITSSATGAISGAGTLSTSENIYSTTATTNVTTNTISPSSTRTSSMQPAFFAYPSASLSNVTGDGINYTVIWNTTRFDQGSNFNTTSGTFTAPIAGNYQFNVCVGVGNIPATATFILATLVASTAGTYRIASDVFSAATEAQRTISASMILNLVAAETVNVAVSVGNAARTASVDAGTSPYVSYFSGFLVC